MPADYPGIRVHRDSDWTLMYVVLITIPVVFIAVAAVTTWRNQTRAKHNETLK